MNGRLSIRKYDPTLRRLRRATNVTGEPTTFLALSIYTLVLSSLLVAGNPRRGYQYSSGSTSGLFVITFWIKIMLSREDLLT
jgi:hypothetical protein